MFPSLVQVCVTAGANYYLFYEMLILLLALFLYYNVEEENCKIILVINYIVLRVELFCVWPWLVLLITELVRSS